MTVYVGDVKAAATFLNDQIQAALVKDPQLERLSSTDLATLKLAARTLKLAIDAAIKALNDDVSLGGLGGDPIGAAGEFPPTIVASLNAAIANSTQQSQLVLLAGYVGRISFNLEAAG